MHNKKHMAIMKSEKRMTALFVYNRIQETHADLWSFSEQNTLCL